MSSKLAFSEEIFKSHELAFIEHYEWLMRWSLHLSNHDRALAEDLVQKVFTQFAIAQTDLSAVQNIPAYLYSTLRNIHVSEMRLAGRSHSQTQSIVDYTGAEAALEATDPYTIFDAQDQLRRICHYACLRKQSSRAGSVLILRYFHGYHVSEVAEVVRVSFQAVRQHLTFARNEARLFLEDPTALKFIQHSPDIPSLTASHVCAADKLVVELREAIFASCQGECVSAETFRALYFENATAAADSSTLAHIVSCPACLDRVNTRLGLPLLAERNPADLLGPNNDWRDGTRGPRDSGGSGSAVPSRRRRKTEDAKINRAFLMRCRRSATELFEHYPRELCVSVNGHVLGSQSVSSPVSRLRFDVTIAEELGFVEVLSEERTRLLVMPIEPPPSGEPVQYRRLLLSENRSLEVTLQHGHPWPMIEVVYEEPSFAHEAARVVALQPVPAPEDVSVESPQAPLLPLPVWQERVSARSRLFRGFGSLKSLWLRPSFVTAIVSLLLIGILLTFRLESERTINPGNLLERARAQESATLPANVATHRVIELEKLRRSDGAVVRKNRIEIWGDLVRGVNARRVYDENGRLTTGAWIETNRNDGRSLRRIYRRGSSQTLESVGQDTARTIPASEMWQLDPSATLFMAMLSRPNVLRVNETSDTYVLDCDAEQGRADGLLKASLTLRKTDLHPIAQSLVIADSGETYDYRFVETLFEHPRLDLLAPSVFQPDAELTSNADASSRATHAVRSSGAHVMTTSELELNVVYALDRFRTKFGDQLSVLKTPSGVLEIRGVVDSEETRNEVHRELSLFVDDPAAIRIRLDTAAEFLARTPPRSGRVIVNDFAGSGQAIPVYADLSQYFSAYGSGQTEQERDRLVRDFAAQTIGRSQRALSHSLELKQLGSRFSPEQFDQFTPSARARWFSLVRNHAEALRRELVTLDEELQRTLFSRNDGLSAEHVEIPTDAQLLSEIDRLQQLVLAIDQAVRSSFAVSTGTATSDGVKTLRFRRELAASIRLANAIRDAVADH
jgi:RNA polymerase sigma factor (sigma-70 family)